MLGERLTYLRRREGISQKELGSRLNLSHYTISSYEKGRSEPNDEIKARIDQPLPYDREEGVLYLPRTMSPSSQRLFRDFITFWESQEPSRREEEPYTAPGKNLR